MLCGLLLAGTRQLMLMLLVMVMGGRVIVWADETTRFNGNITARGGLFSGNGGFAEVSGKQSLDFQGLVDLRSTFGIAGTLLLDPTDITISDRCGCRRHFFRGSIYASGCYFYD
jgi:hypothetical protein